MAELNYNQTLRNVAGEERLAANWQSIQRKHKQRAATARIGWGVAAMILLGIGVTVVFGMYRRNDTAEALTRVTDGGSVPLSAFDTQNITKSVSLSDGSALHLNRHTELAVLENTGERFETRLHEGSVRFDVKPGGPRKWVVTVGQLWIEVVGTSFTIEKSPLLTRVRVHRGKVRVQGIGVSNGARDLLKGDELVLSPQPEMLKDDDDAGYDTKNTSKKSAAPSGDPTPIDVSPEAPTSTAAVSPGQRQVAGDVTTRDDAQNCVGEDAQNPAESPVQLLLTQADKARQAGDTRLALQYLNQIVTDYPNDPASGLAAFTIGRIHLHDLKQYTAAANNFSRAITLGLPHGLQEQAYAKQVESWSHTDNIIRLRDAANVYNRRYPDGTWKQWVERWAETE